VSEAARELAERYLGGEYTILFNGIEIERYRRTDIKRVDQPTIFFCGRYEPRKGLETLLEAMRYVSRDVRLWVASDGVGIDDLRNTYGGDERISWLGRITEQDKLDRLAACSVFCAPSLRGESFGIVLLEAMAAGAPLVASDIDGYRNVALHNENAILVPPGDAVELGAALRSMLEDDELRDRLVEGGRKRAETFSMTSLAHRYIDIYRELLRAETERELVLTQNRFVTMFQDRVLRRSRAVER
jgi:phosphatidylinositol alpha-mannosyltransferase